MRFIFSLERLSSAELPSHEDHFWTSALSLCIYVLHRLQDISQEMRSSCLLKLRSSGAPVLCIYKRPSCSVSNSNKLDLFLSSSFWRSLSSWFCPEPCVGIPSVWNSCPWGPSLSPEKNLAVSCPGGRKGTREEVILDAGGRRWARVKVPCSACSLPPALPPASYSVPCPRFLLRLANPLRLFPDQFVQGTICSFLGGGDLGREPGVLPLPGTDSGPLTNPYLPWSP